MTNLDCTQTDDASVWAKDFMDTVKKHNPVIDEGFMQGWFANAIERSTDIRSKPLTMSEARGIAAQCWCDNETKGIEVDIRLAEAFALRLVNVTGG